MPRKRRVAKLAHRQLTWRDLGPSQKLDYWSAWSPQDGRTWKDYLRDWSQLRAEALPQWEAHPIRAAARAKCEPETLPFAEEVYQAVLGGETPESAAWKRQRRLARVRAGEPPDVGEDEDEDGGGWP